MISLFTFKYPEAVVIPSNVEYEVVSDKDYRDNDRNEALQLLLDFTVKFAGDLGFKYSWAVAHENMLLKKYEKSGFAKFGNPCYELVKKY